MYFHIMTLFPEMVLGGLNESITGKAIEKGLIGVDAVNIRDFAGNRYGHVDDYTYGGGAGMLMQPGPVYDAYQHVLAQIAVRKEKKGTSAQAKKVRVLYMTPQGQPFKQCMAEEYAKEEDLVLLCGHYEGIDERVLEMIVTDYVSIGDFVLTGGELPAMMIVDATSRLVPGVLGSDEVRYMKASMMACWNIRSIPVQKNLWGRKYQRCCFPDIIRTSKSGGMNSRCSGHRNGARICMRSMWRHTGKSWKNADEKKKKKNESGSVGSNVQKCRQMNNYCLSCREIWYIIFIISKEKRERKTMKKRVYIAVVTLALASLFAGCGKKSADAAVSVKDDVVEFVNEELPAAKADHDNAIGIYNAYFAGSSDQDLDAFKTSLQDTAIPAMENCITTISNIEVATDEVKALKDSYLQSVQKECEAMKMVVSAIDGENADYLTQADSLIAEAATLRSDYQTKLQAIANEQGIVVNQ